MIEQNSVSVVYILNQIPDIGPDDLQALLEWLQRIYGSNIPIYLLIQILIAYGLLNYYLQYLLNKKNEPICLQLTPIHIRSGSLVYTGIIDTFDPTATNLYRLYSNDCRRERINHPHIGFYNALVFRAPRHIDNVHENYRIYNTEAELLNFYDANIYVSHELNCALLRWSDTNNMLLFTGNINGPVLISTYTTSSGSRCIRLGTTEKIYYTYATQV